MDSPHKQIFERLEEVTNGTIRDEHEVRRILQQAETEFERISEEITWLSCFLSQAKEAFISGWKKVPQDQAAQT